MGTGTAQYTLVSFWNWDEVCCLLCVLFEHVPMSGVHGTDTVSLASHVAFSVSCAAYGQSIEGWQAACQRAHVRRTREQVQQHQLMHWQCT